MKRIIVTLILLGSTLYARSQAPVFTQAELKNARIFYNGAELSHTAQVNLPQGQTEVIITHISENIDPNTIQIGSSSKINIQSIQFSNDYLKEYDNDDASPFIQSLRKEILKLETQLNQLNNSIETDKQTVKLLDKNSESGTPSLSVSGVEEMRKWVVFYKEERSKTLNRIDEQNQTKKKLEKELDQLKTQLKLGTDDQNKKIGSGKLIVRIMSDRAQNAELNFNYITPNAGWIPSYDIKVEDIDSPIELQHKAELTQTSGLDWENTQLVLTSGRINQNRQIPVLHNWFINYVSDAPRQLNRLSEGNLVAADQQIQMTTRQESSSLAEYTTVQETQLSVNFEIDIPYTVLSNGKAHRVELNDFSMRGEFAYYAVPKLDASAFLTAEISDYSDYYLLPGNANLFFEGVFTGKTYFNPEKTDEQLKLNFGKDPQIAVERKLISDKSGTKFLSAKKEQRFLYEITIKNNKKKSIDLKLEDQFPLSQQKDIEIVLLETSEAKVDKESGTLSWELTLAPGELTKIRFGYQIKSDKEKEIRGL